METYASLQPLFAVLTSMVAAVLIVISRRSPNLRESWTLLAALAKFIIVLSLLPAVLSGNSPVATLFTFSPGISLELRVDVAGMIFALFASFLWIVTSVYSIGYVRGVPERHQTRYFSSMAVCLSAATGVAFAANLLTLFVFYEILTVATYPLVVHKQSPEARSAGRKYLVYLLSSGVVLLGAVALTHQLSGSLDFQPGGFLSRDVGSGTVLFLFVMFMLGFCVKAGMMPVHAWLPAAMVAPTPVSALLHAVAVVKAGVFGMVRVIGFVIGPGRLSEVGGMEILVVMAAATMVIASLVAFAQDNLKRRLAYSTISDLSFILMALAVFSPVAWTGGLMHMFNHAAMKITLFFCAGAIYVTAHLDKISQLDGIGRRMPWTMGAFAIASMGLTGVPPIAGFISKWYVVQGTLMTDQVILACLVLLCGLLKAGYLFPIVYKAFFRPPQGEPGHGEATALMAVPLVITAALSLYLGLFPALNFQLASTVASVVFKGGGF